MHRPKDALTGLAIVAVLLASPEAARGQTTVSLVQVKNHLVAESRRLIQPPRSCPNLDDAVLFVNTIGALGRRYPAVASSQAELRATHEELSRLRIAHGCATPVSSRNTTVRSQAQVGATGGGGGVTTRTQIPELALATLYMPPAERERFIAALSDETRSDLNQWLIGNQTLAAGLKTSIDSELAGTRALQANELLRQLTPESLIAPESLTRERLTTPRAATPSRP